MKLIAIKINFVYKAIAVGVAMVILSIMLSLTYCDFRFGDTSCPAPDASVWIGAVIGAITTAMFFYVIDKPVRTILKKFDKSSTEKVQIGILSVAFVAIIFALAFILSITYCAVIFGNVSCPTPDAQIWMGAVVGVATTALFFYFISKRFKCVLEELGKLYIARTCILNLVDIFGKEHGKGRIKKSETNRQYFLKILDKDYIKTFDIKEGTTVKQIYDKAYDHKEIDQNHDHNTCDSCKDIMKLIKKFDIEEENIIVKNLPKAEKFDWINRS